MDDRDIRAALERSLASVGNPEAEHAVYRDDVVLEFPQSGERFVGLANVRAMREAYPALVAATVLRIRGSGDLWVSELVVTYDGQNPWYGVAIMELRDGKVAHETIYGGEPWQAPAWRARWAEPAPLPATAVAAT